MLKRSPKAKRNKASFYHEYNSIDIFIEDTAVGYKKLFTKLLSRILSSSHIVSDVFPLGGRIEVISACEADQLRRNRARLYIIDGDLYLLTGENLNLKGLYVLPRYCIENHLLCISALLSIMEEEDPERDLIALEGLLDFTGWVDSVKNDLLSLFIEYGVAKSIAPHLQTVKYGYKNLISGNSGDVDRDKVNTRIHTLRQQIIDHAGQNKYDAERERIGAMVTFDYDSFIKYISAKDILMPLLMMRIKKHVKITSPNLTLKHRISNICDIDSFGDVSSFICSN